MINVIRWLIPDVPKKLAEQIAREEFLTNELIMAQELRRAKEAALAHRRLSVSPGVFPDKDKDFESQLRMRSANSAQTANTGSVVSGGPNGLLAGDPVDVGVYPRLDGPSGPPEYIKPDE
jgi:hypothetical protein